MPPAEMAASSAAFMLFRIRLATRTHHYIKELAGPACNALLGLALGRTLTHSFQLLAEPSYACRQSSYTCAAPTRPAPAAKLPLPPRALTTGYKEGPRTCTSAT
ncbi:hypothetical protein GSI_09328 [Ganoderma sinense ZZ0214-1]|uniref:Uncharacterized protein n=1 Tax=Ganoderma sinense ZZ0214-1 TaxID=1077348 RepID=A0A2G8S6V6_9APHY|nr:hypothetical protein GSI_09328 [Ganoderma sinense ZZ0214-1]